MRFSLITDNIGYSESNNSAKDISELNWGVEDEVLQNLPTQAHINSLIKLKV